MALTVTSRGTGTHNTGATTLVPGGRTATLAAGSMGVLAIALDNAGSGGATVAAPTSWTDAKGNVWTRRINALFDNGAASAGIEMVWYTAPITVALLTTDLGTITWAGGVSPVAKAWTWYEVIPGAGNSVTYNTGNSIAGAAAANATVVTATVAVGDAVIAGYFAEGVSAVTGDSDTTNGTWTAQQTATIGATTSGVRIATQQKVQTTTPSTQSYDVTVASQDRIAGYIMLSEVVSVTGTGAITVPSATVAGTGAEVFTATGSVTVPSATVAGTGTHTVVHTGTGAISVPAPTVAGTGTHTAAAPSGTGSITVSAPTVAGTGVLSFSGTGAITVPSATVAGTGLETITGTGAIVASVPTVSGGGEERFTATGAIVGQAPTISGTGLHAPPVTGTGSITVSAPVVDGTGSHTAPGAIGGTGEITVPSALVSGVGVLTVSISGTGAISVPAPLVAGVGTFGDEPTVGGMAPEASATSSVPDASGSISIPSSTVAPHSPTATASSLKPE
jgi:fibronectin-binding autotransporter adhesin